MTSDSWQPTLYQNVAGEKFIVVGCSTGWVSLREFPENGKKDIKMSIDQFWNKFTKVVPIGK